MKVLKPIYTTMDSVKVRLHSKVQFQEGAEPEDGELPTALLAQLIRDAETQVEQELRGRYAIPFQNAKGGDFHTLPDSSQRALRVAIDSQAVMMILSTDFGRGSATDGSKYYDDLDKAYNKLIKRLLGRDEQAEDYEVDKGNDFRSKTPPLEDVKLARSNSKADDGYRGKIINGDASLTDAVSYAEGQLNNPSLSFRNGTRILF